MSADTQNRGGRNDDTITLVVDYPRTADDEVSAQYSASSPAANTGAAHAMPAMGEQLPGGSKGSGGQGELWGSRILGSRICTRSLGSMRLWLDKQLAQLAQWAKDNTALKVMQDSERRVAPRAAAAAYFMVISLASAWGWLTAWLYFSDAGDSVAMILLPMLFLVFVPLLVYVSVRLLLLAPYVFVALLRVAVLGVTLVVALVLGVPLDILWTGFARVHPTRGGSGSSGAVSEDAPGSQDLWKRLGLATAPKYAPLPALSPAGNSIAATGPASAHAALDLDALSRHDSQSAPVSHSCCKSWSPKALAAQCNTAMQALEGRATGHCARAVMGLRSQLDEQLAGAQQWARASIAVVPEAMSCGACIWAMTAFMVGFSGSSLGYAGLLVAASDSDMLDSKEALAFAIVMFFPFFFFCGGAICLGLLLAPVAVVMLLRSPVSAALLAAALLVAVPLDFVWSSCVTSPDTVAGCGRGYSAAATRTDVHGLLKGAKCSSGMADMAQASEQRAMMQLELKPVVEPAVATGP